MLSRVYVLISFMALAFSYRIMLDYLPVYYIKTTNIECHFEPQWMVNISCKLKAINWEKTNANISADIVKPLKNPTMRFQMFRRESRYVPFLVDIKINCCDGFENKSTDFYSKLVMKYWNKYSNIKPVCPLKGHLEVRNLYVDQSNFPLTFPTGMYKVVFTITEGNPPQLVGHVNLYGTLVEKPRVLNKNKGT